MRTSAFCAWALAVVAAAKQVPLVEDAVKVLGGDTFENFIEENELVLAEFYAPWCGHCKALAPEFAEAAKALEDKDIHLAKIDCTVHTELCQKHGVEGYPTLKVFRGPDSIAPYSGARKAQAIISYMTKQALPPVSLLTADKLEAFKTSDPVVLVGYFGADDKASNETFTQVADSLRDDYVFGAVSDEKIAAAEGVSQPAIVLYKSFDEGKNTFTKAFEVEAITKFAKAAATPLVGEVGPDTYQGYIEAGIPLAYIFAETPEERKTLAQKIRKTAKQYRGKINFATIDAKAFGQHAGNLNLEVGKWPAFAIQDTVKNLKFPYDQSKTITTEAISKFVDEFNSGNLKPSVKSEPVPESQEGPVTVLVADNYEQYVMDDTKDVLVEYYAPWCGHCKALEPKYKDLGDRFQPFSDKVTIAKVDATLNDVPEDIQGFPTIKLFAAGKKSAPITFSGERTVEELTNFIKSSGTHQVDPSPEAAEKEREEKKSKEEAKSTATEEEAAKPTHDEHDEL